MSLHWLLEEFRSTLLPLRCSPGFAHPAVTLAFGIRPTDALLALLSQVLLQSAPVHHPERLYSVCSLNNCFVMDDGRSEWRPFSDGSSRIQPIVLLRVTTFAAA